MARTVKRFTEALQDIRGGDLVAELTEELRQIVTLVKANGGRGEITLKLRVKRALKGASNSLVIVDEVRAKPPKFQENETILFANEEGDLQRSDPRQPKLTGMDGNSGAGAVTPFPAAQGGD